MSKNAYAVPQGPPSVHDHAEDSLAQSLSELARDLQAADSVEDVVAEVVGAAVALIPGADEASISVVTGRRLVTPQTPSGGLPDRLDRLQTELGEGPCLDAAFDHETVRVPDMANDPRWPRFAPRAVEMGAASMLSIRLYVEGDKLGALNLYAHQVDAFGDESEHVGLLFASQAAVAFADAQTIAQLEQKAATRDLIGQAKGILMERHHVTADQAFTVLTRYSRDNNRKLRDVAADLVTNRRLPDRPSTPTPLTAQTPPRPRNARSSDRPCIPAVTVDRETAGRSPSTASTTS